MGSSGQTEPPRVKRAPPFYQRPRILSTPPRCNLTLLSAPAPPARGEIPAYAGMTEEEGPRRFETGRRRGVGSRFRGNDDAPGELRETGLRPVSGACAPSLPISLQRPLHNIPSFRRRPESRGAQAPHPPLPIRGEDAANAAGEGTAVGAQAPSFRRRPESIRRFAPQTGRSPVSLNSPGLVIPA